MARLIVSILFFTFLSLNTYAFDPVSTNLHISTIERSVGVRGHFENNLFKISVPRDDLNIVVNGMLVTSDMGLTSWVTFKKSDDITSLSGEIILLQDQVNPVMSVALANGLEVKALYSPFLWDSPRVLSMRISGSGNEIQLGLAVRKILKEIKKTVDGNGDFPFGNTDPGATLDPGKIEAILGAKGFLKNGTYKVVFGKEVHTKTELVDKVMASNTWASFVGSDEESVIDGNIVVREAELQNVLKSFRRADIYILAIDHHNINDDSGYIFIHYWGIGSSTTLARVLRTISYVARNDISHQITGKVLLGLVSPSHTNNMFGNKFNRNLFNDYHPPVKKTMIENISSGISQLILSLQDKVFNYVEKITVDIAYALAIANSEIHAKKIGSTFASRTPFKMYNNTDKLSKEFNDLLFANLQTTISIPQVIESPIDNSFHNSEDLLAKIKTALHVKQTEISNALLKYISIVSNTRFTTAKALVTAFPIIFLASEAPSVAMQTGVVNLENLWKKLIPLMHLSIKENKHSLLLNLEQSKNYNHVATLMQAKPVTFPVEKPAPVIAIKKPEIAIVPEQKGTVNTDNITTKLTTAMHIEKTNKTENMHFTLPAKNYNHLATLIQAKPVTFQIEKREPKIDTAKTVPVVAVKKPEIVVQEQKGTVNTDNLTTKLITALHIKKVSTHNNAPAKNYDHLAMLMKAKPVTFTFEKPAVVAKKEEPKVIATKPVIIPEQKGTVNSDNLTTKLTTALHIEKTNKISEIHIFAPAKNYNHVATLMQAKPVIFPVEKPVVAVVKPAPVKVEPKVVATKPTLAITKPVVAKPVIMIPKQKGSVNTDNISTKLTSALHIEKTNKISGIHITAPAKNYNHVATLMQARPVIFPVEKPVVAVVKPAPVKVEPKVVVTKPTLAITKPVVAKRVIIIPEQKGTVNTNNITTKLTTAMHVVEVKKTNAILITAPVKNYNHVTTLMQARPVIFPVEKPAITPPKIIAKKEELKTNVDKKDNKVEQKTVAPTPLIITKKIEKVAVPGITAADNLKNKLIASLNNAKHNILDLKPENMTAELKNYHSLQTTMKKIANITSDVPVFAIDNKAFPKKEKIELPIKKIIVKNVNTKSEENKQYENVKAITNKLTNICLDNKYKLPKIQRPRFSPAIINYAAKITPSNKKTQPFVLPLVKNETTTPPAKSFVLPLKEITTETRIPNPQVLEKAKPMPEIATKNSSNGKKIEPQDTPKPTSLPLFAAAPKKVILKKIEIKKHVAIRPHKTFQTKRIVKTERPKLFKPIIRVVKTSPSHRDDNFIPFDGLPQ